MVQVYIESENITKNVNALTPQEILKKLKINPETVIISRNEELILLDQKLENNDEIKLLSVISGG
ncbi:thiamine biosynthesis protein ThiS [archaeon]|nr:thiamine biosynthesis protein ThiS [archaeon]